jgi:hypothetical protein
MANGMVMPADLYQQQQQHMMQQQQQMSMGSMTPELAQMHLSVSGGNLAAQHQMQQQHHHHQQQQHGMMAAYYQQQPQHSYMQQPQQQMLMLDQGAMQQQQQMQGVLQSAPSSRPGSTEPSQGAMFAMSGLPGAAGQTLSAAAAAGMGANPQANRSANELSAAAQTAGQPRMAWFYSQTGAQNGPVLNMQQAAGSGDPSTLPVGTTQLPGEGAAAAAAQQQQGVQQQALPDAQQQQQQHKAATAEGASIAQQQQQQQQLPVQSPGCAGSNGSSDSTMAEAVAGLQALSRTASHTPCPPGQQQQQQRLGDVAGKDLDAVRDQQGPHAPAAAAATQQAACPAGAAGNHPTEAAAAAAAAAPVAGRLAISGRTAARQSAAVDGNTAVVGVSTASEAIAVRQ